MHSKFEYKYLLTFSAADHFFDPILLGADPILQLLVFMVVTCSIILGVSRRGGEVLRGKTAQREMEQVNAIGGWLRVI